MAKKGSGSRKAARSAVSGKFVTKGYAKRNPRITVMETIKKGK